MIKMLSNLGNGEIAALVVAAIAIVILLIVIKGIKIVPQTQAYVVERLGKYYKTWGTGVHFLVPFIDKIATDPKELIKAKFADLMRSTKNIQISFMQP